ncbi:MAG: peptidoglycan-binding domain-containing protein [Ilumatobacteraceae bacterium]
MSYRRDSQHPNAPSRQTIELEVIPWLVDNHEALGIQRVHDYWDRRYWQVGRGWIGRPPGARNDHLHVEVTPETWGWDSPIGSRLSGAAPASKPKPPAFPGQNTRRGSKAKARVSLIQNRLNALGFAVGRADGSFGPRTHAGVEAFQKANGLTVDGIVGRNTWAALFA